MREEPLRIICITSMIAILFLSTTSVGSFSMDTISRGPASLSPPSDPLASPGIDKITLTWEEPELGYLITTGFSLYRSDDGIDFELLSEMDRETFHFEDHMIVVGITYHYYLRSNSDLGQSDISQVVSSAADDIAPVVEILDPSDDELFGVDDVEIIYHVDEGESGIGTISYSLDGGSYREIEEGPFSILELENGDHSVGIRVSDLAGNIGMTLVNFRVDTEAPHIRITSPVHEDILDTGTVIVEWDVGDNISDIDQVLLSLDDGPEIQSSDDTAHTFHGVDPGPHGIVVIARDSAGNTAEDRIDIICDLEDPWVEITSPDDGEIFNVNEITLKWRGNDPTTDVEYRVMIEDSPSIEVGRSTGYRIEDVFQGEIEISVFVEDQAGHMSTDTIKCIVDRTSPVIDLGDIDDHIDAYGGRVEIPWRIYDDISGMAGLEISINGDDPFSSNSLSGFELDDLAHGNHTLEVYAYDRAGNYDHTKIGISVDLEPPTVLRQVPSGMVSSIPDGIEITFSESMDAGSMKVSSDTGDPSISGTDRYFRIQPGVALEFGNTYRYTISGEDLNGNRMVKQTMELLISDRVVLEGRIVDTDGRPIEGAIVTLGSGKVNYSGPDGRFRIESRMGNITIFVTKDGYQREKASIHARPDRQNWVKTFRMREDDNTHTQGDLLSFFRYPVNILILLISLSIVMVISALTWRYFDREKITEVDIQWEYDQH